MTLVVRRATADEIMPLRHAVLRPGHPDAASIYAEDATAVHLGGWDGGTLVACATVFPQPWPGSSAAPAEPAAWRLRGMAVDPTRQGQGVGGRVLDAAIAAALDGGAPLMWANARVTALGFYTRAGWMVAGEEFVTADTGLPHRAVVRLLAS